MADNEETEHDKVVVEHGNEENENQNDFPHHVYLQQAHSFPFQSLIHGFLNIVSTKFPKILLNVMLRH